MIVLKLLEELLKVTYGGGLNLLQVVEDGCVHILDVILETIGDVGLGIGLGSHP